MQTPSSGRRAPPALFLLVLSVLAGCAGDPAEPLAQTSSPASHGLPPDEGAVAPLACSLIGTVHDATTDEPIEGAALLLLGTELVAHSNASGGFDFGEVPAGDHRLLASRSGYETGDERVRCQDGSPLNVAFRLDVRAPPSLARQVDLTAQRGRIGCSVRALWYSAGNDPCRTAGVDTTATAGVTVQPPPGRITGAVLTLEWVRSSVGSDHLGLYIPKPDTKNFTAQTSGTFVHFEPMRATGPSPLTLRLSAGFPDQESLYELQPPRETLEFPVRVLVPTQAQWLENPTGIPAADVVVAQDYTLYVTLLYEGAPLPALGNGPPG